MQLETKYLRLPMPVTLGSRFGDWQVCWLGGWGRDRMFYLVMLVRVTSSYIYDAAAADSTCFPARTE